jgi:hypothetical protein
MDTATFFARVLPRSGLKVLAELVPYTDKKTGKVLEGWRYTTYQSFDAMAQAAAQFDAHNRTIYHACNGYGDWYFDDLAINDSNGSFQNSWPGDGAVIRLKPNAAGDASDWTNDYTAVDEVTPDEGTTLVASKTLNHIYDYDIEDTHSALTPGSTINVVQVGVRYNGASGSANSSFVTRIKASSGGTVEEGTAITPAY